MRIILRMLLIGFSFTEFLHLYENILGCYTPTIDALIEKEKEKKKKDNQHNLNKCTLYAPNSQITIII